MNEKYFKHGSNAFKAMTPNRLGFKLRMLWVRWLARAWEITKGVRDE